MLIYDIKPTLQQGQIIKHNGYDDLDNKLAGFNIEAQRTINLRKTLNPSNVESVLKSQQCQQ